MPHHKYPRWPGLAANTVPIIASQGHIYSTSASCCTSRLCNIMLLTSQSGDVLWKPAV